MKLTASYFVNYCTVAYHNNNSEGGITIISLEHSYTANKMHIRQFCTSLLLCLLSIAITTVNANLRSRPVVGILSQPLSGHKDSDYIAGSYVKWLESAGARSIVIPYDADEYLLDEIFTQINGVLFPGGDSNLPPNANYIWKLILELNAKEDDYFPVWGTCMGFEFLVMLAGGKESVLQSGFDSHNISLPLIFPTMEDVHISNGIYSTTSELYPIPSSMRETLVTSNITMNNHHQGITPTQFLDNSNLTEFFHITSTNFDRKGRPFVSTIESKNFPIYGTQYHPEKNNFEFGLMDSIFSSSSSSSTTTIEKSDDTKYYYSDEPYEVINHSEKAVELSIQLALLFVGKVRRSTNGHYNMTKRHPVVYRYPVIRSRSFEQKYVIPKAGHWNHNNHKGTNDDFDKTTTSTNNPEQSDIDYLPIILFLLCTMLTLLIVLRRHKFSRLSSGYISKKYFYIPDNPDSFEILVE